MASLLMEKFAHYLLVKIIRWTRNREPDVIIGDSYLKRWHLIPENKLLNVYYHEIRASDLDRHLHDHPYFFSSFILNGEYIEHTVKGSSKRSTGDLNIRTPWKVHRLEMTPYGGANTIFITGPKIRKWGFETEHGWVVSDKYLEMHGTQNIKENS